MKERELTAEHLKSLLKYDQDTGIFTWRYLAGSGGKYKAGSIAGTKGRHGGGYIEITILGQLFKAHRLAWLYMTGEFPKSQIDHINRDRADNRWSNLREATLQQNLKNKTCYKSNTTGCPGVTWHKRIKKFQARISSDCKRIHLGYYENIHDAESVYKIAKAKMHNFSNGDL